MTGSSHGTDFSPRPVRQHPPSLPAGEDLPEHNGDLAAAPNSRNAQQRAATVTAGVQWQPLPACSSAAEAVTNTVVSLLNTEYLADK